MCKSTGIDLVPEQKLFGTGNNSSFSWSVEPNPYFSFSSDYSEGITFIIFFFMQQCIYDRNVPKGGAPSTIRYLVFFHKDKLLEIAQKNISYKNTYLRFFQVLLHFSSFCKLQMSLLNPSTNSQGQGKIFFYVNNVDKNFKWFQ